MSEWVSKWVSFGDIWSSKSNHNSPSNVLINLIQFEHSTLPLAIHQHLPISAVSRSNTFDNNQPIQTKPETSQSRQSPRFFAPNNYLKGTWVSHRMATFLPNMLFCKLNERWDKIALPSPQNWLQKTHKVSEINCELGRISDFSTKTINERWQQPASDPVLQSDKSNITVPFVWDYAPNLKVDRVLISLLGIRDCDPHPCQP